MLIRAVTSAITTLSTGCSKVAGAVIRHQRQQQEQDARLRCVIFNNLSVAETTAKSKLPKALDH